LSPRSSSTAWRVRSSSSGHRCPCTSGVSTAEECPSRARATRGGRQAWHTARIV
jgi:hypothetical protein